MTDLASRLEGGSRNLYVAFVDLLGFSDRVRHDWSDAAAVYGSVMSEAARLAEAYTRVWAKPLGDEVPATMQTLSDSLVIVGSRLVEVGVLTQAIQSAALVSGNMLVRGGIAFGAHSAVAELSHSYVVSHPLVVAAGLEAKVANYPRIVLDRVSGVESEAERLRREGSGLFMECDDGLWMVQPFSLALEQTNEKDGRFGVARGILEPLVAKYKATPHSPKYDWMLSCVDRVASYLDDLVDHPDNPANDPHAV